VPKKSPSTPAARRAKHSAKAYPHKAGRRRELPRAKPAPTVWGIREIAAKDSSSLEFARTQAKEDINALVSLAEQNAAGEIRALMAVTREALSRSAALVMNSREPDFLSPLEFVARQLRLEECMLRVLDGGYQSAKQEWPRASGTRFLCVGANSAIQAALKFSELVLVATCIARKNVFAGLPPSDLKVIGPQTDPRLGRWQQSAIEKMYKSPIGKPPAYPIGEINSETGRIQSLIEDEFRQAMRARISAQESKQSSGNARGQTELDSNSSLTAPILTDNTETQPLTVRPSAQSRKPLAAADIREATSYAVGAVADLAGLNGGTINKYARTARVQTPKVGGRNHRFTVTETKLILNAIIDNSGSRSTRSKCHAALAELEKSKTNLN